MLLAIAIIFLEGASRLGMQDSDISDVGYIIATFK